MNKLNTTLPELLNMLKIAKSHFKSEKALLLVDKKKSMAERKDSKRKQNPKGSIQKRKKAKDFANDIYFHCGKQGHWKKNCKSYLVSLKYDASGASKDLYMIQTSLSLSASTFNSWILDTACGFHICKSL